MSGVRERKKRMIRETIIRTAAELFQSVGFEKTTMTEVARRSDLGVGTLYNYFPSKTDLLLAIVQQNDPDLRRQIAAIMQDQDRSGKEKLKQAIRHFMNVLFLFPREFLRELLGLMFGDSVIGNDLARKIFAIDQKMMEEIARMLKNEQEHGRFPATVHLERLVESIYSYAIFQSLQYFLGELKDREQLDEKIEQHIDFMVDLIANQAE